MAEQTTSSGRRPPRARRGPRPDTSASAPLVDLASIPSPAELVVFNTFLDSEKDAERERQRIRQAEAAKDKAAAQLKQARDGGTKDEVAEADAAYREAVEALRRIQAGEPAAEAAEEPVEEPVADVAEEPAAEPVANGADEPAAEPVANGADEPAEEPVADVADEPADVPAESEPTASADEQPPGPDSEPTPSADDEATAG